MYYTSFLVKCNSVINADLAECINDINGWKNTDITKATNNTILEYINELPDKTISHISYIPFFSDGAEFVKKYGISSYSAMTIKRTDEWNVEVFVNSSWRFLIWRGNIHNSEMVFSIYNPANNS